MGNCSGKRLSNWVKKANRRALKKIGLRQKRLKPTHHYTPPGYYETHQSIVSYIRRYIRAYHSSSNYTTLIPGNLSKLEPVQQDDEARFKVYSMERITKRRYKKAFSILHRDVIDLAHPDSARGHMEPVTEN